MSPARGHPATPATPSPSVVAAAETARAFLDAGRPGGRAVVAAALQRADEPGELLAYWRSRYGRSIPKPVKRGIGDARFRLLGEYPLLKYDTGAHAYRFADVLALVHPGDRKGSAQGGKFRGDWQRDLFGYAIDRRYGRDEVPASLPMIAESQRLRAEAGENPSVLLDAARLKAAGMTWEDALSLAGPNVGKRELWTALGQPLEPALSASLENVPAYTWNLAGEKFGHGPSGVGFRHAFGGLTDHSFTMISLLEAGRDANWNDLFGAAA